MVGGLFTVWGDEPTPTPTQTQSSCVPTVQECKDKNLSCSDCENYLRNQISNLQGQGRTLSTQISVMDNQARLTQLRIDKARRDLDELEKEIGILKGKISNLEIDIDNLTRVLANRIVATYQTGTVSPWQFFLSSGSFSDFLYRLEYLRIAQVNDKRLVFATQATKNNFEEQKKTLEAKQKQVEALNRQLTVLIAQLNQQKKEKEVLLAVTNNDETRYQKLLQEARAQIQAFKSFASSQGGAQILPPQSSPDGWFYNQRDERWGRNNIGDSTEQVWDVGCLVTSVAMVLKQAGSNITPADIAANGSYYFSSTAYMLLPWAGGKFSSAWGFNQSSVDNRLSIGKPVIVGLKAGPYGQHFVVLKSGANGDYLMNDPWNGANLKFTDYYSTGQIFQYGFYNG